MAVLDSHILSLANHRRGPRSNLLILHARNRGIFQIGRRMVQTARTVSGYVGFQMNMYLANGQDRLLDALIITVLVVNSALLVCTVAETVWCSHDTLTANTFLGCQTAKSLYVGCLLFLVFRGSSGPSTFELWFLLIGTAGLIW
jgi:hypothetical protein